MSARLEMRQSVYRDQFAHAKERPPQERGTGTVDGVLQAMAQDADAHVRRGMDDRFDVYNNGHLSRKGMTAEECFEHLLPHVEAHDLWREQLRLEREARNPGQEKTRQEAAERTERWRQVNEDMWRNFEKTLRMLEPGYLTRREALEVLGLADNATPEDINRAYRRLAMQHHPDRGGDAEAFEKVQRAYEQLTQV